MLFVTVQHLGAQLLKGLSSEEIESAYVGIYQKAKMHIYVIRALYAAVCFEKAFYFSFSSCKLFISYLSERVSHFLIFDFSQSKSK